LRHRRRYLHRAKTVDEELLTRHVWKRAYLVDAMMNEQQIKGQWDQLKGKIKRAWGELTDDDFMKAEGSMDKLAGIIQERFGDSKEAVRKKLDRLATE
jgi:uncharacterized protein YjbJ (UPF0337 family)